VTISNIQTNQAGNYVATYTNTNGCNSTNTFGVTVTTTGTLPSPWQTSDIGSVAAAGSASYSSGTFTEAGSGADIWNTADGFRYVYQPVSGNVEIIARVASLTNTDNWAKAGVMVRQSLTAGSIHAITVVTSGNGIAFQNRTSTDGNSNHTAASGSAPYWVRLVVSGSTVTSYASSDGSSWTQIGSVSLGLSGTYYVGLCVTSHNDGTLCTSTIDNVTVNTGTTVSVTGVTVSPASASVNVGSTTSLTATVSPSNATNKNVSWNSSNTSVATVSSTGVVTGVAAGSATITVTTADGGFTATSTITVSGACTTCGCTFGAPTATALPSVNKSYNYGYVLGTGGPNMSNLSNFTINWDLANNGLYQLSVQTTNGNPNWYNDLRTGATQNFASAQPSITLSGTGFSGLDGSYYATVYNGDFVLVSKAGGFTIYFSNSTTAPSCTKSAREVTGVDVLSANVFSIFPNPVNKDASVFVNLKTQPGGASFFITDLSGKIIITGNLMSSDNSIALNGKLSSGIYFVRITNGNEQFNQKLIVK
jgi:endoglucanase